MLSWIRTLDRILPDWATRPMALQEGTIDVPFFGLSIVIVVLGLVYGVCMGTYSLVREMTPAHLAEPIYLQLVASTVKVSALFLLTLLVTFPSLYVSNALVGSRLTVVPVLRPFIVKKGARTLFGKTGYLSVRESPLHA